VQSSVPEESEKPQPDAQRSAWIAVTTSLIVTVLAALTSRFAPPKYVATIIGLVFLGVVRLFVWGESDAIVREHGLALGGLVIPDSPFRSILHAALRASAYASVAAIAIFGFYALGFYLYFFKVLGLSPRPDLALSGIEIAKSALADFAGQLLMVALPEEAFYRGYLQTKLERAFTGRKSGFKVAGLPVLAIVLTSLVFAVGHVATIPNLGRLAVFFPSLVFGALRSRSGGIGAGLLFHAVCNVFSTALGHAFGLY
jgi:uncharacterized protein